MNELSEQERKSAEEYVDHGWSVVQEIWRVLDEKKAHGLLGRVKERKERRHWRENGAFENVQMAERVLEARKRGENVDDVYKDETSEIQRATTGPKEDVVDEITDDKAHKTAA